MSKVSLCRVAPFEDRVVTWHSCNRAYGTAKGVWLPFPEAASNLKFQLTQKKKGGRHHDQSSVFKERNAWTTKVVPRSKLVALFESNISIAYSLLISSNSRGTVNGDKRFPFSPIDNRRLNVWMKIQMEGKKCCVYIYIKHLCVNRGKKKKG